MTPRASQYPGSCIACGKPYAVGDLILWDKSAPRGKRGRHADCNAPTSAAAGLYVRDGNQWRIELESVQAVLEAGRVPSQVNAGHDRMIDETCSREETKWYGIAKASAADIQDIIAHGWPEGVARMQEHLKNFDDITKPRSLRRRRRWADQGDAVDMPRVWAGRVDVAWQRCEKRAAAAPQSVTIAANVSALGEVDAEILFWRGAAVLKLSDLLSEAGYNVEIFAVRFAEYTMGAAGAGYCHQRVKVKDALAPLDVMALSGVIAFPGFYRYGLFKLTAAGPVKIWDGEHPAMYTSTKPYPTRPGEIGGVETIRDAKTARSWIEQQLRALEGPPQQLAA